MVDVDDVDAVCHLIDPVDDPVASATGGVQADQLASQRSTQPARLFGEWPDNERQTGDADLLRQSKDVTLGPT